jgi:hypothetical protein
MVRTHTNINTDESLPFDINAIISYKLLTSTHIVEGHPLRWQPRTTYRETA